MGESPIYSCQAHVFTIDPKTKKTWLPASSQAIKVSFFFDKTREQYRILSIDDLALDPAKKMPINSIVTEKMSFKKTSQKFGQWADTASSTVYGLGFANEIELDKFVEQFCQALDHTRRFRKQQPHQQQLQTLFPTEYEQPIQHPHQQLDSGVDLDQLHQQTHHQHQQDASAGAWRGEVDRLTAQLQQTALSLQKVERENQTLRAGGLRASDSDARVAQLEKENFMLKARIKQLEDTVTHLDQQLKDVPALVAELRRRLQEAGDFAMQLASITAQQTGPVGSGHKY